MLSFIPSPPPGFGCFLGCNPLLTLYAYTTTVLYTCQPVFWIFPQNLVDTVIKQCYAIITVRR
nr:MAG TPA: hypothetical protein [Caudoviricetes sp.]